MWCKSWVHYSLFSSSSLTIKTGFNNNKLNGSYTWPFFQTSGSPTLFINVQLVKELQRSNQSSNHYLFHLRLQLTVVFLTASGSYALSAKIKCWAEGGTMQLNYTILPSSVLSPSWDVNTIVNNTPLPAPTTTPKSLRRNSEVNKITLNKDKAIKVKVSNEMTSIEATVVPSNYHDSVTDWPSGECVTVWWSYINVVDIVIEDDWMAVSTYGECAWYHHKIFVSIMMTTLSLVRLNLYNCRWNVNHACKPKHDLNSPPLRPLSVNNSSPLSGQWVCNEIFTT